MNVALMRCVENIVAINLWTRFVVERTEAIVLVDVGINLSVLFAKDVLFRKGIEFGFDGWMRFTFKVDDTRIEDALDA